MSTETGQQPPNTNDEEKAPLLRYAVAARVSELQTGYIDDRPDAVASLARLRRGAGKLPADTPELWGDKVDLADCRYPAAKDDQAETAIHIAMSLFALHQQSHRASRMHQGAAKRGEISRQRDLGWAVRELTFGTESGEPARRRLVQAGKAVSIESLALRLRGLVQLLRGAQVPLDYGLLAHHLLLAQQTGMHEVRRAWGRGYSVYTPPTLQADNPHTNGSE